MSTTLTLLVLLAHKVSSQCTWTVDDKTLNLSPLQGVEVEAFDNQDHIYTYTICENQAGQCSARDPLMCKQVAANDPSLCYEIGRWEADIMPTYNMIDEKDVWTFKYSNGGQCNPSLDRSWSPAFICNPDVELEWGDVTELFGSCNYELTLETRYACRGWTTTLPPIDECEWTDVDTGNILNLTRIQGFILNKVSDNDPSQIYSLSACSNNINCNGEMGMTTIGSISNCIQNIAKWDGGFIQPRYSSNFGGQWEFVYTNGDPCNNSPTSVVSIFWNCNPFAGTGTIIAAREVGICNFEIQIDSNLACSSSKMFSRLMW
eukprot:60884_1